MSSLDKVLVLGGLLKRIGNFSTESFEKSFESRLIFQKTIYLLQSFELYLGFSFSWYIRGPYSPDLARKGYDLVKKFSNAPGVRFSTASSESRFLEFLEFLGERKYDAEWLEMLASIHFLKNVYPGESKKGILSMVLQKQPYLTIQECEDAWSHLERFRLIRSEVRNGA